MPFIFFYLPWANPYFAKFENNFVRLSIAFKAILDSSLSLFDNICSYRGFIERQLQNKYNYIFSNKTVSARKKLLE